MEDLKLSKMSSEIKSYINEGCNVEDEEHFGGENKFYKRNNGERENNKSELGGSTDFGKIKNIYHSGITILLNLLRYSISSFLDLINSTYS